MSRYEYEPLRDAMITAIPRGRAPSKTVRAANEASDDELEAEYQKQSP